jgi:glucosamine-6-phosphate deaminase
MEIRILNDYDGMSVAAAQVVKHTLNSKPNAVLGLATGSTPLGMYKELARMHREENLDFSQVTTFNLDEYVGLGRDDPQSYHFFMHENLFRHVNIPPHNIYIPSGTTDNYAAFCQWYEQRIRECGGIDLQILGIGSDGHIAFNEPSSSLGSRTRIKTLARQTIEDNSRFFDRAEDVPVYAITMGVGTILEARKIILLASGENKATALAAAIEGPVTSMITASALQLHRDTICYVDRAAAGGLKMIEYYDWVDANRPSAPTLVPRPHFDPKGARVQRSGATGSGGGAGSS